MTFYEHFKQDMERMGLPAPASLFATYTTATATTKSLADALKTFGSKVTIGDLIGAGKLTEKLSSAQALAASFYLGACIGCPGTALLETWQDRPHMELDEDAILTQEGGVTVRLSDVHRALTAPD
jgi:hypothetical protein